MAEMNNYKNIYSVREKEILASLVEVHKNKLHGTKVNRITNRIKQRIWYAITESYNCHNVTPRTVSQLRKCWENMKYKTRKSDLKRKYRSLLNGNDPLKPEPEEIDDPLEQKVRAIVSSVDPLPNWESIEFVESDENEQISLPNDKDLNISNGNETNYDKTCNFKSFASKKMIKINEEEMQLRVTKMQESINQQKELHSIKLEIAKKELKVQQMKLEAATAEKEFWLRKQKL